MLESWVRRARHGDRRAFQALYTHHVDAVYGTCLAFCRGDEALAGELTQEAFVRAFERLDTLREPAAFPGWLMAITRRCCLAQADAWRQERGALERLHQEPRTPPDRPDRVAEIVGEVIDACPDPALRVPASLFYRPPPHTTAEIAARLGLSRTAVTTRLHRFRTWARRRMLRQLAEALEDPA